MTLQETDTTGMTAIEYMMAADGEYAAGNETKAAGLMWKAVETTFVNLAQERSLPCENLLQVAKALDVEGRHSPRYYRSSFVGLGLLEDHAQMEALEPCELKDALMGAREFVLGERNGSG